MIICQFEEPFKLQPIETIETSGRADPEKSIWSLGKRLYRTTKAGSLIPRGLAHLFDGLPGSGPEALTGRARSGDNHSRIIRIRHRIVLRLSLALCLSPAADVFGVEKCLIQDLFRHPRWGHAYSHPPS